MNNYTMRGSRVPIMQPNGIQKFCEQLPRILGLKKSTLRHMDKFIEDLCHAGLNIEIIADNDWLEVADAWCIPEKAMISMPENLYMRIINKDTRALHIFFNELGHFMLAHRAVLHYNDTQPCQYEDSEWQADYFADCMMEFLGVRNYKQLPLF